jgi:heptaprenyl diphosphate synthase
MVFLALLTAMSLALYTVESLLPPLLPLPGVKLGLANIMTLIALFYFPRRQVFLLVVARLFLGGLLLGLFLTPPFWISCGGGLVSFAVMALCRWVKTVSPVGLSLAGAAAHHLGQLLVVALLIGNDAAFYYLPWLLLWSVPVGLFTGFSARGAIRALRNTGKNDTIY